MRFTKSSKYMIQIKLTQTTRYTKFEYLNKNFRITRISVAEFFHKFLKILEIQNILKSMIIKVHAKTNMTKLLQNS